MHLNLERTAPGACPSGTGSWYNCASNGSVGCCTVDACDLSTCPDTASSSSSALAVSTLSSISTAETRTVSHSSNTKFPRASLTSTAKTLTASSTSEFAVETITVITAPLVQVITFASSLSSTSPLSTTISSSQNVGVASATTASPTSPPLAPISSKSHTGLIVGVVTGMVVILILSVAAGLCIRRSQQRKDKDARQNYGLPKEDFVLDRSNTDLARAEVQPKTDSDVFAMFGGRYKSPNARHAELAPIPVQGEEQDLEINQDDRDSPLPDVEKSGLTPPPVHEHPAYQAPPVQFPEGPIIHPETTLKPPATVEYPAYYTSQIALTGPLARITDVHEKYNALPRGHNPRPSSFQTTPLSMQMKLSPVISSPIPGHSELEADVPASYITHANTPVNRQYQQYQGLHNHNRNHSEDQLSTYTSSSSSSSPTSSKPIGLDVLPSSSSPNIPLPSTFIPTPKTPQTQTGSRPFIGEEVISKIQVSPTVRPKQAKPLIPHLRTSHMQPNLSHHNHNLQTSSTLTHSFSCSLPSYLHAPSSSESSSSKAEESANRDGDRNMDRERDLHLSSLKEIVSPLSPSLERWSESTMVPDIQPSGVSATDGETLSFSHSDSSPEMPNSHGEPAGKSKETAESHMSVYSVDGSASWGSWDAH